MEKQYLTEAQMQYLMFLGVNCILNKYIKK